MPSTINFPFRFPKTPDEIWRDLQALAGAVGDITSTALYDAIIDPSLSASVPSQHLYVNLGEAVVAEVGGPDGLGSADHPAFTVGVVHHSGYTIIETANISSNRPITIESIGFGHSGTPLYTGNLLNFRQLWDFNGFTIALSSGGCTPQIHPLVVRGLEIVNTGAAIGTLVTSTGATVVLDDCRVAGTDRGTTVKITTITGGFLFARHSVLESITFSNKAYLVDVGMPIYRTANYTLTSSDLFWFGGYLNSVSASGAITISLNGSGQQSIIGVDYADVFESSSSAAKSLAVNSTGTTVLDIRSLNNAPNITVSTAAGHVTVEGDYNTVTFGAATTVGRQRVFKGSVASASTFNGPGNFDIHARSGAVITFSGNSANVRLSAHSTAAPVVNLVGCDDSLFILDLKPNGAAKPYAIDANSDRSILLVAGANQAGWGSVGTNASATSIVIDENTAGLSPTALAEFIRDTIGTALLGTANQITVTVNDPGDTITLSLPSPIDVAVRHLVGPWVQDNVAASQTNVTLAIAGDATRTDRIALRAGSVTGIVVRSNAARTLGTLTVEVMIDAVGTGLTAVLDGTNTTFKATTQAAALDAYTAGQRIGVRITTDGTWAPTTADITVEVEVVE